MEEPQARIIRLQTESNLAKQPYPALDDSIHSQGEANVVELSGRQPSIEGVTEAIPTQRSAAKRKQATSAKRKGQNSTPKSKTMSFRQLREVNQQPYADELKRLEAQAERINQLLADREIRKTQQSQSADPTAGKSPAPVTLCEPSPREISQQANLAHPSRQEVSMSRPEDDDTESLKAQATRINQLLAELEAAIAEEEAITQSSAPTDDVDESSPSDALHHLRQPNPQPPRSNGHPSPQVTPFAANQVTEPTASSLSRDEQEAAETAQALRYLAGRDSSKEPLFPTHDYRRPANPPKRYAASGAEPSRPVKRARSQRSTAGPLIKRYGLRLKQLLQIPQKPFDKVGDAVLWIVLSAVTRLGTGFVISLVPALSPVFSLLMLAPAALAVYLAVFVPKAGFVSVYRLFLIMLGLLIGGKLW